MPKQKFEPGDFVRVNQPFDEVSKAIWQVHDVVYKDFEPEEIWYYLKPPGTFDLNYRTTARIMQSNLIGVGKNISEVNPDNIGKIAELVNRAQENFASKKSVAKVPKDKKIKKEKPAVKVSTTLSGEKPRRGRPPGSKNKNKKI